MSQIGSIHFWSNNVCVWGHVTRVCLELCWLLFLAKIVKIKICYQSVLCNSKTKRCTFFFLSILKKGLEDISPFHGATDTPVLDFW